MHKLCPGGIQSTKPKRLVISNQARDWQRIKAQQPRSNQRRHVPNQWLDKADEHIATDFLSSLARRPISLVPRKVREFNRWNGINVGPVNRNRNKTRPQAEIRGNLVGHDIANKICPSIAVCLICQGKLFQTPLKTFCLVACGEIPSRPSGISRIRNVLNAKILVVQVNGRD